MEELVGATEAVVTAGEATSTALSSRREQVLVR
jgi:hypothetical protein